MLINSLLTRLLFIYYKDPIAKLQYYIDHRNQRESQILEILREKAPAHMSDMDIVKIVYSEIPDHLWPAAAQNVHQHLRKLSKERRIIELNDNDEFLWQYNSEYISNKL